MSTVRTPVDVDEIAYAKSVAVNGRDRSAKGNNYYSVVKLKQVKDIPGVVILGCVVETEVKRTRSGIEQDFGHLKIMFYILFDKRQINLLQQKYPESKFNYLEHSGKEAIFLSWGDYRELLSRE